MHEPSIHLFVDFKIWQKEGCNGQPSAKYREMEMIDGAEICFKWFNILLTKRKIWYHIILRFTAIFFSY